MSIKNSAIGWTGPTWNPWRGCKKKTQGCTNCYMYREYKRYGLENPCTVTRTKPQAFNKPLKLQKEVDNGIRTGHDRLVFTCSWSDWFNEEADEWRGEAWDIIRDCPGLIFQILTKLPKRGLQKLPPFWDEIRDRVWMGVTVENQDTMYRVEYLKRYRCAHRFLSLEPLIGPVKLRQPNMFTDVPMTYVPNRHRCVNCDKRYARVPYRCDSAKCQDWKAFDWVIVGGESGERGQPVRPMHPDWVRWARDYCTENGIPFYFKQWGEWGVGKAPSGERLPELWVNVTGDRAAKMDRHVEVVPGDNWVPMSWFGRKKTGDKFEEKTWTEVPEFNGYQQKAEQLSLV